MAELIEIKQDVSRMGMIVSSKDGMKPRQHCMYIYIYIYIICRRIEEMQEGSKENKNSME